MAIAPKVPISCPLLSPPAKRIRRKGSDATIKSKPSVESLDSCDKGALSRLGTIDQMGTPGSTVEPSPRPRKLQFSPPVSQETLIGAKTPTHNSDSNSSKPSVRMRQYLQDQKKQKQKAEAKAKIRRSKAFTESPKTVMKKPAAAKAAPARAPSGASVVKPSQKALSLAPPVQTPPQEAQQAQPEAELRILVLTSWHTNSTCATGEVSMKAALLACIVIELRRSYSLVYPHTCQTRS